MSEAQSYIKKANAMQVEERDTAQPFVVNHLFAAILQGMGGHETRVPGIWKNTREEVMWDNTKLPWHRSPAWLLLRIMLQTTLSPATVGQEEYDDGLYKRFMIFFMSFILDQCLAEDMTSDILSIVNAKISRRLVKLDLPSSEPWLIRVRETVARATRALEDRWSKTITVDTKVLDTMVFDQKVFALDLHIMIPKLDTYVQQLSSQISRQWSKFMPPEPDILACEPDTLPVLATLDSEGPYGFYNLAVFEHWVANHLNEWMELYSTNYHTCERLQLCIKQYFCSASTVYQDLPEGTSMMVLTIYQLWVACDRAAIESCPLIGSYKPVIPIQPLGALLLRSAEDMKRLHEVEQYIMDRMLAATFNRSILTETGTPDDFSSQFYASSTKHQILFREIEKKATSDRAAKRKELQASQEKYARLIEKHQMAACNPTQRKSKKGRIIEDHAHCAKCRPKKKANELRVQPHEWPLPEDPFLAQTVVVELQVPHHFGIWRDSTFFVLDRVLGFEHDGRNPIWRAWLRTYQPLSGHFRPHSADTRIGLLTEIKPHARTHRQTQIVNLMKEKDVCLEHGPRWKLMDKQEDVFLKMLVSNDHVSNICTQQLADTSETMQHFLNRPWQHPDGANPNEVIARQDKCPPHFAIDEFKALSSLPLGQFTQWSNVLVQLAMPSIDWNKIETFLFIWQLAEQCGPASPSSSGLWRRSTHERLSNTTFIRTCLENLRRCLGSVRESWESRNALAVFTLLGSRLLTMAPSTESDLCLDFLDECRNVSYKWQQVLRREAFSSQDDDLRLFFALKAHEAALICLSSFDLDDEHNVQLLSAPGMAKIYLESLITMQETSFSVKSKPSALSIQLNLRCRRVIKRIHIMVENVIAEDSSLGLDAAIQSSWPSFKRSPGRKWDKMETC